MTQPDVQKSKPAEQKCYLHKYNKFFFSALWLSSQRMLEALPPNSPMSCVDLSSWLFSCFDRTKFFASPWQQNKKNCHDDHARGRQAEEEGCVFFYNLTGHITTRDRLLVIHLIFMNLINNQHSVLITSMGRSIICSMPPPVRVLVCENKDCKNPV